MLGYSAYGINQTFFIVNYLYFYNMSWTIKVIEDIAEEPVTLAEVKEWLRIDATSYDNDNVLNTLIASCREKLEGYLGVYFGVKSVEVQLTGSVLKLPYGPTQSVNYVERVFTDDPYSDTEYQLKGLDYKTIFIGQQSAQIVWWYPANMGLPYIQSGWWPFNNLCVPVYNIYYTTGYLVLPKLLKNALLLQIDYQFKNQGKGDMFDLCPAAMEIANRFSQNNVIS